MLVNPIVAIENLKRSRFLIKSVFLFTQKKERITLLAQITADDEHGIIQL